MSSDPRSTTRPVLGHLLLLVLLVALAVPGATPAGADDRDLLREGVGKPYVFIVFDTSGSMHWSPKCTQEQLDRGECDVLCPTGDCFVPMNGDDPSSKLYQAKEALYEVIDSVDSVDFGFAAYNQDELRVEAKHWLYRVRSNGPEARGVPMPAAGTVEVFGAQWPCDTGRGDDNIGCYENQPADLDDPWERDRVRRLPKGGIDFTETRRFFVRQAGETFEITYRPVSGSLGDATIDVEIEVDECSRGTCRRDVPGSPAVVTFERMDQFVSWDIGTERDTRRRGYFAQYAASDAAASDTCGGWEGNEDGRGDDFNGVNLKLDTTNSPISDLLDRGDMIPLDWNDDNRSRILSRLAPNRLLGETVPDFSVARYLEDTPGNRGVLELADRDAHPLIAFGSTPLGNSIADFRECTPAAPRAPARADAAGRTWPPTAIRTGGAAGPTCWCSPTATTRAPGRTPAPTPRASTPRRESRPTSSASASRTLRATGSTAWRPTADRETRSTRRTSNNWSTP